MERPTGLTRDAGWELGVKRTVAVPPGTVWQYLLGPGLADWLGQTTLGHEIGDSYETTAGVRGEIRSRTEWVRIRLTWQPADWDHDSTLQLTVTPTANGTTIALHQERLVSAAEREQQLAHWTDVVQGLARQISATLY